MLMLGPYGRTAVALLFPMALLLAGANLSGQETSSLLPGQRVRVLLPAVSSTPLVGEVLETDDLDFAFRTETGRELSLGLDQADSLWVWNGTSGSSQKGAVIGAGVGLVAGVVLGMRRDCGWWDDCGAFHAVEASLIGLFAGGVGVLIGAGLGELVRHDNWMEFRSGTRPPR